MTHFIKMQGRHVPSKFKMDIECSHVTPIFGRGKLPLQDDVFSGHGDHERPSERGEGGSREVVV